MQWILFMTTLTGAASMALAPSLKVEELNNDVDTPGIPPTVDSASGRSAWVSSYAYGGKAPSVDSAVDTPGVPPTVDSASGRSAWVSSYSYGGKAPTVDSASGRSDWVSSYSYGGKAFEWEQPGYWLPTGPGYLDLESLEKGYDAHSMIKEGSNAWLHARLRAVKRFFTL